MSASDPLESTNTPSSPFKHHQRHPHSDSTLSLQDGDGSHHRVERGGNPVETSDAETDALDADRGGLSIPLLHKGFSSPTSQRQRSEGKHALLKDHDQEEEEKLQVLRRRRGRVGDASSISIQSKHQKEEHQDGNQDQSRDDTSNDAQDPDSTLTMSSSPRRRGEDHHRSDDKDKEERKEKKENSDGNSIQKDGHFVIFRDSQEISDSIMKGGDPFGSMAVTSLSQGKGQEVLEDDETTDENQKPDWLIDILECKNQSKLESNPKRKGQLDQDQDQVSSSSSHPHRKSSRSNSNSSSSSSPSRNKQHQVKNIGSSLGSDAMEVEKQEGKKAKSTKAEERSEIGKGKSSSSSPSIIETRAQKKRKVTPKISVQTQ